MAKSNKFGTFGGVFTPSILTILGVIMYLRLPMIVGEAGLLYTIGIIVVAHIISATTGLSVSSIATDKKVQAGGTYYMISRSLGLSIGGTLGLALFVGLSFSVSLYVIGFSESFLNYWELEYSKTAIQITGTIVLLAVTTITFISTSLAIKSQYVIMTAIVISLISILFGNHDLSPEVPLLSNPDSAVPLMVLFGIFFPAVTGFEAGVSMSGDLKDPKKSIPVGSISAIVVGFIVYIALAFFFSYTVTGEMLRTNPNVLLDISWVPELVIAGIWGATISSALGSILGAPRILQATAVDKITPKIFAKGVGATNEPRNALLLTFVIAEVGILIGELDVIARIVSIFFITTYGFLNLSCAFEALTSTDFRPSFKTPVWVSFFGAAACFLVMIQLDFVATLGATLLLGLLFLYLKRKELSLQSGDAWSGVWASLVKAGIERLNKENLQTRNWRPNIIMFLGEEKERPHLAQLGIAIAGKLGMLSSFELVESSKTQPTRPEKVKENPSDLPYYHHVHYASDVYVGMEEISRIYGFSGVQPNTVLMGWSKKKDNEKFLHLIENFSRNDLNSIFLKYHKERKFGSQKTIDIWWSGWGRNLSLAINIINPVAASEMWREARVRLLVVNPNNTQTEKVYRQLERILANFRMRVEIELVNNEIDQLPVNAIIERESKDTDLTIIGIPSYRQESLKETYSKIVGLVESLGTTLLINASTDFEEYDLELESAYRKDERVDEIVSLPDLQLSKYPEVAEDIKMIDSHGQKLLEAFYLKSIREYFAVNKVVNEDLIAMAEALASSVQKISALPDSIRAERALSKIRSELYFRSKKILSKLIETQFAQQKDALESGVEWYIHSLQKDLSQFPKHLEIKYPKEDMKVKEGDSGSVKWLKFRRKLAHPFRKEYVPGSVNYKEVAQYYVRDSRFHFLSAYLSQFENTSINYLGQVNAAIMFVDSQLEILEKKIENEKLTEKDLRETRRQIEQKIKALDEEQRRLDALYKNRLLVEFRKNMQLFNNDLEKLNINRLIQRKRRGKKFYANQRESALSFAENWFNKIVLVANKNYLDTSILSFRDRVYHETEEFIQETVQELEVKFLNALDDIEKQLKRYKQDKVKIEELKWQKLPPSGEALLKDFEERGKKLTKLASDLPENITIIAGAVPATSKRSREEEEVYDIHVNKIVQHFLESQYLSPVHETLEKSSETIKSLVFNLSDMLSLIKFSIANVDADLEDQQRVVDETVSTNLKNIEKERERVKGLRINIRAKTENLLEDMFEALSSYKIHESSREFSYLVRDYQSRKVLTKFGAYSSSTRNFVKDTIVKLLYSKSEGVLLAQRLAEDRQTASVSEKVLDVVDQVTPDFQVLDHLPHYYQSLFSGRSSIGENFWIQRESEETAFRKALSRYREGYQGAIAVLGERNSGKTSFCMRVSKRNFSSGKVFHLFPITAGSISTEDFFRELRKATMIEGSPDDVMNALPHQAVLVIHDLELWWERSSDGLEVVRTLERLINEYSHRCLFIVNTNPFAYELINKLHPIERLFISTIRCRPFLSEDIRDLIMLRHRSSGLHFRIDKKLEGEISDIKLARLFNEYFNYSEGNPGVTLNAWLANIVEASTREISITFPEKPNGKAFERLPEDWNIILVQLIIHKRLSFARLGKVLRMNEESLRDALQSLSRSGLVKERSNGIYYVNSYIEPFLVKSFKQKEWL